MGRPSARDDRILTQIQARLIVALHNRDLNLYEAADEVGVSYNNAAGKVRSIQLHTGVDVLTLHGLGQLYDAAKALVDHWEGTHGQAD